MMGTKITIHYGVGAAPEYYIRQVVIVIIIIG